MKKLFQVNLNIALNHYDVVSELAMVGKKCKSVADVSDSPLVRKTLYMKVSFRFNKIALILMLHLAVILLILKSWVYLIYTTRRVYEDVYWFK